MTLASDRKRLGHRVDTVGSKAQADVIEHMEKEGRDAEKQHAKAAKGGGKVEATESRSEHANATPAAV
jgi:hypothetical protein